MSPAELKTARRKLGLSQQELSDLLRTPCRTYQDWEAGRRRIPGIAAVAMSLLASRDERVMADIKADIAARIERDFAGRMIVSAVDRDFEEPADA